ncbi:MAG: ATP-binding protein [Lachnospiraceae bacterium]|nr:ATP-binding protein [Lachnospiraceae bacterium]
MKKKVALGITRFEDIIDRDVFYVDKTRFIKDWYDSADQVTLITRPRRFGKTLTLNMVETFFSIRYQNRSDLFDGLCISEEEELMAMQGTLPVINLSLANVKQDNYESMCRAIRLELAQLFEQHSYLLESDKLSEAEKESFIEITAQKASDEKCMNAVRFLSQCMYEYYGETVLILIDEYDTPMLEAFTEGYWESAIRYIRRMFHAAFKDNPYLRRGLMTGITRITQESIFSDLNNLSVVTTTTEQYEDSFGFTEREVFEALETYGFSARREAVKYWYDGFQFGKKEGIYNPWSILNFLKSGRLEPYWMNTSGNALVGNLVRKGSLKIKDEFETLLQGGTIETEIDESITYAELRGDSKTIWSWFLTTGYVKIVRSLMEFERISDLDYKWMWGSDADSSWLHGSDQDSSGSQDTIAESSLEWEYSDGRYEIALTNFEVRVALRKLVKKWFAESYDEYTEFIRMLLAGNLEGMQRYMEKVTLRTFSFFDVGGSASESETAEQFYHGFTLGLIADLDRTHILTSNRESGFGRYDVSIEPRNGKTDGIVIEFKVFDPKKEETLEDTAKRALQQIEEKKYETDLKARGIGKVRKYGFAFRGKEVLIQEAGTEAERETDTK